MTRKNILSHAQKPHDPMAKNLSQILVPLPKTNMIKSDIIDFSILPTIPCHSNTYYKSMYKQLFTPASSLMQGLREVVNK